MKIALLIFLILAATTVEPSKDTLKGAPGTGFFQRPPANHTITSKSSTEDVHDEYALPTVVLLALTLLGTWALVIVGMRSARKQLRAYISVEPRELYMRPGGFITPTLVLNNYGQTPANEVSTWAIYELISSADIRFGARPDQKFHGKNGTIPPKRDAEQLAPILFPTEVNFSPAEIARFQLGHSSFYFYGETTYKDVFRRRCITKFRFEYISKNKLDRGPGRNAFAAAPCPEGNAAE